MCRTGDTLRFNADIRIIREVLAVLRLRGWETVRAEPYRVRMPSGEHEAPAALFRRDTDVLWEAVDEILGVELPQTAYTEAKPTEIRVMRTFHADGVGVGFDGQRQPVSALVFEVQRRFDPTKTWTWQLYVDEVANEWQAPTRLVVFCPDGTVAKRYRAIYQPQTWPKALQPLIFTAEDVPIIADLDDAAARPTRTLFYTTCRAQLPEVADTFAAVITALRSTGEKRGWQLAQEYDEIVSAALQEGPAAKLWEAFVSTTTTGREYRSRLWDEALAQGEALGEARGEARGVAIGEARGVAIGEARGVAIGEARGVAIGEARGEAHGAAALGTTVLALLGARQVPISEAVAAQILACTDLAVMTTWAGRAQTATAAEDVVRP
jgi:hypothetical protein